MRVDEAIPRNIFFGGLRQFKCQTTATGRFAAAPLDRQLLRRIERDRSKERFHASHRRRSILLLCSVSGSPLEVAAAATGEVRKDVSTDPKGDAGISGPSTAAGAGKEEDGGAGAGHSVAQAEGGDSAKGKEEDGADNARRKGEGTRVAVKIQQVPVDEVRGAIECGSTRR